MKVLSLLATLVVLAALIGVGLGITPRAPEETLPEWEGRYYNNFKSEDKDAGRDCYYYRFSIGLPLGNFARYDNSIDFNWGQEKPVEQIDQKNFMVCWQITRSFTPGVYRIWLESDDGSKLWMVAGDPPGFTSGWGNPLIDMWHDQSLTRKDVVVRIPPDENRFSMRVDYYQRTGDAAVRLWCENEDVYPHWKGQYFYNDRLSGCPAFVRDDPTINFDWGAGSAGPLLSYDHFSVRWTRTLPFAGGYYRFYTRTDDGVRLWVDDTPLIDQWHDQAPTTYTGDIFLTPGDHSVKMEYYESGGGAVARLWWETW